MRILQAIRWLLFGVKLRDVDRSERKYLCCRERSSLRCERASIVPFMHRRSFIERCRCGRRHFIMEAERGEIGLAGCSV